MLPSGLKEFNGHRRSGTEPDSAPSKLRSAGQSRTRQALWSAAAALLARASGSLTALVSIPIVLGYLGPARYGVWITVSSMAGWLSLLDIGIGYGLQNAIARESGYDNAPGVTHAISTASVLGGIIVALASVLCVLVAPLADWGRFLNVHDGATVAELLPTIQVTAVLVLVSVWTNLGYTIVRALQRGYWANLGTVGASVASLACVWLAARSGAELPALAASLLGPQALAPILIWMILGLSKPFLLPRLRVTWSAARELLTVGFGFLFLQVAVILVFQTDAVIISRYSGPAAVTPFSIAQRVLAIATLFFSSYVNAHWPAYAEASARGDWDWVTRAHSILRLVTTGGTLVVAVVYVLIGPRMVELWVGPQAVAPWTLYLWLAAGAPVRAWTDAHAILLNGLTALRWQIASACVHAVISVGLALVFVRSWGAVGVAAAGTLGFVATSSWALPLGAARALRARHCRHSAESWGAS